MFSSFFSSFLLFCIKIIASQLSFWSKLFKKGSGTALPGLLIENYFLFLFEKLGKGFDKILFITGTNGKTTTRSIINHVLAGKFGGGNIATNTGGANILRGIASTLLLNLDWKNKPRGKILILEVEEASLPILTKYIQPDSLLITNLFRDQLDLYGECDKTIFYFNKSLENITKKLSLIINFDDKKLLSSLKIKKNHELSGFSVSDLSVPGLDFENVSVQGQAGEIKVENQINQQRNVVASKIIQKIDKTIINYSIGNLESEGKKFTITLPLVGVYNVYNFLAAMAFLSFNYNDISNESIKLIEKIQPVFGRGEKISIRETNATLFLVKNPAGFNGSLKWLCSVLSDEKNNEKQKCVICLVNDNIADGRDVSWLWDVDFETSIGKRKSLILKTGGTRGFDMLRRLQVAGINVNSTDNFQSFQDVVEFMNENGEFEYVIFHTYTALMELRKLLGRRINLQGINKAGN